MIHGDESIEPLITLDENDTGPRVEDEQPESTSTVSAVNNAAAWEEKKRVFERVEHEMDVFR